MRFLNLRWIVFFLSFNACQLTAAGPQTTVLAPVERSGFTTVTSYDSLQAFLREIAQQPSIRVEQIAQTRQGRSVNVVRVTTPQDSAARIRILLFAQQHGDEPAGKEALTLLLAKAASGGLQALLSRIDLFVVPLMNPDGAELGQRRTADRIDLNRSHVLLHSPEVKGLHDLFRRWMPQVTVDVHEYSSSGRAWSDSGFIKTGDVQLGMLTNLNSPEHLRQYQHEEVFPFIAGTMRAKGYTFHEYIVGEPADRIRHSTTEINDGRQSFGILGTMSFIQEGRKWSDLPDHIERRAKSQLASLEAMLEFCSRHAAEIRGVVEGERRFLSTAPADSIVLRMEHAASGRVMRIPVQMTEAHTDTTWNVHPYHDRVYPYLKCHLPSAYLIPAEQKAIIDLLGKFGPFP